MIKFVCSSPSSSLQSYPTLRGRYFARNKNSLLVILFLLVEYVDNFRWNKQRTNTTCSDKIKLRLEEEEYRYLLRWATMQNGYFEASAAEVVVLAVRIMPKLLSIGSQRWTLFSNTSLKKEDIMLWIISSSSR